jgi:SAM-dependent methyltransferase
VSIRKADSPGHCAPWSRLLPESQDLELASPNAIYERGLDELLSSADPSVYYAVDEDGRRRRLPLDRWISDAPADEELLLDRAVGPVLDIGCGAGRHLAALAKRGIDATGVEVSRLAVEIARRRNVDVIHGSVFDLPTDSRWMTALLLDGNVGIRGEPGKLLDRVSGLLDPAGRALVEVEAPGTETRVLNLHLEGPDHVSEWFAWAWVGADGVGEIARMTGLVEVEQWSIGERWFSELRLPPDE